MIKKLLIGILMVMVMSGVAMAGIQPSDPSCNDFFHVTPDGQPSPCFGEYQLQDMGEFVGGVWVWNTDFEQAANPWMSGLKDWFNGDENWTWQEQLKPYITEGGGFHTDIYLMRRIYADPNKNPDSRVQVIAFNEGTETKIPVIYLSECRKWDENNEVYSVECPDTYDPTIDYTYFMNFWESPEYQERTAESTPIESVDVKSVEWDGVLAEQVPYAITPHYNFMKYDTDKSLKLWKSNGIYDDEAVTYWHFDNKVPTAIGPVTLTVTLADDSTFTREINVTSVDDMPTISAFVDSLSFVKVRPNGKLVTKTKTFNEGVSVQNINLREIDDPDGTGKSLVIQWPVPDGALFGSKYRPGEEMQLRLYVGKTDLALNEEVFLFIDCPPQVGTVVIDAENYNWLKDTMTDRGMSLNDIEMTIFYRAISTVDNTFDRAVYHNRGYSDKILFTPVQ